MTVTTQRPPATTEPTTTPTRRRRWHVGLILLGLLCFGMLAYRLPVYLPPVPSNSGIDTRNALHYGLLVAHIFTASIAIGVGSLQFWPGIRRRFPTVHRWLGRTYFFLGVFPSAIIAVPVALLTPFGASERVGLLVLAGLWFGTGVAGYRAIRAHRYADHRRWMVRNFALTSAAAASRLWQPIMILIALPQLQGLYHGNVNAMIADAVGTANWVAWTVNLLIAEAWLRRKPKARRAVSSV